MNDEQIRDMFFTNGRVNGNLLSAKIKKENDPAIEYLKSRFDDSDSLKESLYRVVYSIEKKPVCPVCGKPVKLGIHGYKTHCSVKCAHANPETTQKAIETCREHFGVDFSMQSKDVQEKSKQTNLEKYGVEYPAQNKEIMEKVNATNYEKYGMKRATKTEATQEKYKETCRKRFGTDYALQSEEVKQKGRETAMRKYGVDHITKAAEVKEKIVNTNLERYGVRHAQQTEEVKEKIKKTLREKFGVDNPSQSNIVKEKKYRTQKRNGTFNTSKFEEIAYKLIKAEYPDVIRQYKSEKYPYHCDFYIPQLDLYIELNYSWTHGKHPFDPDSEEDRIALGQLMEKAVKSDYYANAVEVWTKRDPEKKAAAEKENLRYLAVYRRFDIRNIITVIKENFTNDNKRSVIVT